MKQRLPRVGSWWGIEGREVCIDEPHLYKGIVTINHYQNHYFCYLLSRNSTNCTAFVILSPLPTFYLNNVNISWLLTFFFLEIFRTGNARMAVCPYGRPAERRLHSMYILYIRLLPLICSGKPCTVCFFFFLTTDFVYC